MGKGDVITQFRGVNALCRLACEEEEKCKCYEYDSAKRTCDLKKGTCEQVSTAASGNAVSGKCGFMTNAELKAKIAAEKKKEDGKKKDDKKKSDKKENTQVRKCSQNQHAQVWGSKTFQTVRTADPNVCKTLCVLESKCQCWSWGNWGKAGGKCRMHKGKCKLGCKAKVREGVKVEGGVCVDDKLKKTKSYDLKCKTPTVKEAKKWKPKYKEPYQPRLLGR